VSFRNRISTSAPGTAPAAAYVVPGKRHQQQAIFVHNAAQIRQLWQDVAAPRLAFKRPV
jgi:hypothetical protein